MGFEHILIVVFGALMGGFVSGLTGFGTGITAMGIWLYALTPTLTATLVICCSIVSQLQTLPMLFRALSYRRVLPFLIPGVIAVPVGTILLSSIDARTFKQGIGCLLLLYSVVSFSLLDRSPKTNTGKIVDGVVGFLGGVLGGIAGLSGVFLVIWSRFKGWTKDQRRSTLQIFNLSILCIALFFHAHAGLLNVELGKILLLALPGTVIGSLFGSHLYRRSSDIRYEIYILVLLFLAGTMLLVTSA